ncbi:4Fe-4S dicluster domain-containing protein [Desulfobotulus sp. H1]|uniref:4Fe-4S dicluster domain-containing protein n=1 Tax=Desulfobotulus pelophilus TaxID=2823377 RepID=A0ABT3ND35_9BACT|nr:4Fe-4S dicluster domain-containing protein [Desulfobotulus pelophilus]MCW7755378.1 4Fe-4S dicluster domain-containing protein [Desulfobotulus pelophilus]
MIVNRLLTLGSSRLRYALLPPTPPSPDPLPLPSSVTLLMDQSLEPGMGGREALLRLKQIPGKAFKLQKGDAVSQGQILQLLEEGQAVIAPISGVVTDMAPYVGDYGRVYMTLTIEAGETDMPSGTRPFAGSDMFRAAPALPGKPALPETPPARVIINGLGSDVLATNNQYVLKTRKNDLEAGLDWIRNTWPFASVHLMVAEGQQKEWDTTKDCRVYGIAPIYPAASPRLLHRTVTGEEAPAEEPLIKAGTLVLQAEALASMGTLYATGVPPMQKLLQVMGKDGVGHLVSVCIGTPVSNVLEHLGLKAEYGDNVILGGPMTGYAVYAEDFPICPDTDTLLVQAPERGVPCQTPACLNCGACVRICPARVPVNLLLRVLEAGHYEEAAEAFDLMSCIDCGLCSFVCPGRIPIFQYIQLAKYEHRRHPAESGTQSQEVGE